MTFGSLFAGIGGMDLGLERAGLRCVWQVEIDDWCRRVLAKHWPNVRRHDDVRTFPPTDASEWGCDVIAGGFPCQDISSAGKRAGLDGKRSGLWSEYARVVRLLRPRFVVVENVSALLNRELGRVLGDLAALGYGAEWHCLPAAAFGAPHIRERVFVVADRNDRGQPVIAVNGKEWDWLSAGNSREAWLLHEPDVDRMANGIPCRVDRLRGLGNAVVPPVAEWIGRQLMEVLP